MEDDHLGSAAATTCRGKLGDTRRHPSAMYRREEIFSCTQACRGVVEQDPDPVVASDVEHPAQDD